MSLVFDPLTFSAILGVAYLIYIKKFPPPRPIPRPSKICDVLRKTADGGWEKTGRMVRHGTPAADKVLETDGVALRRRNSKQVLETHATIELAEPKTILKALHLK